MHFITLVAIAAAYYTLKGRAIARWGPAKRGAEVFATTMQLASRLVGLGMAISVLGTLLGCCEVFQIVVHAPPAEFATAMTKGFSFALVTITWALLLLIPVTTLWVITCYQHTMNSMSSTS